MLSFDPIATLAHEHVALEQLFMRHQEALVMRVWARAARLLEHYCKRLEYQIQLEERYLLPYWAEEKTPGQSQASIYVAEHRRLEELMQKTSTRLALARRRGITPSVLVALLDEEKILKQIIGSHYQREEIVLFAVVRQTLPEEVRSEFVHILMHQSHAAHTGAADSLRR